jgi:nucleotide-binding universal stress UspA family protein
MIQLNRILVPTDFSEYGTHALRYGCEFAQRFKAELHLLHIVDDYYPLVPEAGMLLPDKNEHLGGLRAAAERELAQLPDPAWISDMAVIRAVGLGKPFVEIIRYAREEQIDLIVVGSHGRTGLAHMLMGSVAERVVRKAPCPVLTVRPGQHEFVMP